MSTTLALCGVFVVLLEGALFLPTFVNVLLAGDNGDLNFDVVGESASLKKRAFGDFTVIPLTLEVTGVFSSMLLMILPFLDRGVGTWSRLIDLSGENDLIEDESDLNIFFVVGLIAGEPIKVPLVTFNFVDELSEDEPAMELDEVLL